MLETAAGRQLTPENTPTGELDTSAVAYLRSNNLAAGHCSALFF